MVHRYRRKLDKASKVDCRDYHFIIYGKNQSILKYI